MRPAGTLSRRFRQEGKSSGASGDDEATAALKARAQMKHSAFGKGSAVGALLAHQRELDHTLRGKGQGKGLAGRKALEEHVAEAAAEKQRLGGTANKVGEGDIGEFRSFIDVSFEVEVGFDILLGSGVLVRLLPCLSLLSLSPSPPLFRLSLSPLLPWSLAEAVQGPEVPPLPHPGAVLRVP